MRKILQIAAVLMAVAAMVSVANADTTTNIVQNGTFALGSGATFNQYGYVTLFAGSTALPGWTVGGNSVDVVSGNGQLWQAPPSGGNSIDLSGNNAGLTSQVLDTSPVGSLWTISFYLAGNYASTSDKTLLVTFGSQSWTYVVPGGNTAQNMGWQLITISSIRIDTTPTSLTFTSLTSGLYGPVIAGISVVDPPTVPEPSSTVLFGTGLLGLGLVGRFRKSLTKFE